LTAHCGVVELVVTPLCEIFDFTYDDGTTVGNTIKKTQQQLPFSALKRRLIEIELARERLDTELEVESARLPASSGLCDAIEANIDDLNDEADQIAEELEQRKKMKLKINKQKQAELSKFQATLLRTYGHEAQRSSSGSEEESGEAEEAEEKEEQQNTSDEFESMEDSAWYNSSEEDTSDISDDDSGMEDNEPPISNNEENSADTTDLTAESSPFNSKVEEKKSMYFKNVVMDMEERHTAAAKERAAKLRANQSSFNHNSLKIDSSYRPVTAENLIIVDWLSTTNELEAQRKFAVGEGFGAKIEWSSDTQTNPHNNNTNDTVHNSAELTMAQSSASASNNNSNTSVTSNCSQPINLLLPRRKVGPATANFSSNVNNNSSTTSGDSTDSSLHVAAIHPVTLPPKLLATKAKHIPVLQPINFNSKHQNGSHNSNNKAKSTLEGLIPVLPNPAVKLSK
jgi:hypothetical protein